MIAVDTIEVKQRLARNVRRLMQTRGWSARELARRAGEHNSTISRILNADNVVGLDVAERVAAALDTSIDHLLRNPEEMSGAVA